MRESERVREIESERERVGREGGTRELKMET